mgnify:CR=1 FL=1
MAVKLNNQNLYELREVKKTETANYIYGIEAWNIGVYRLLRRKKNANMSSANCEYVKMPEIYRAYFGKRWKWYD